MEHLIKDTSNTTNLKLKKIYNFISNKFSFNKNKFNNIYVQ